MAKLALKLGLGLIGVALVIGVFLLRLPKDERLRLAASRGDTPKVRDLVMHGANVNSRDSDGSTALMCAAAGGHSETTRELLSLGAAVDVDGHPGHQDTALYYAVLNSHSDVASILLKSGADPNLKMGGIYSPVIVAARKCDVDMLKTLTGSSKLDLNVRDDRNNTPVILALSCEAPLERKKTSVELLIAYHADVLSANAAGETACSIAGQQPPTLTEVLGSACSPRPRE